MKPTVQRVLFGAALAVGALFTANIAHAAPMEWAWIGPYSSTWTCEQARDSWPVASEPCVQRDDGAYFRGLRQATP